MRLPIRTRLRAATALGALAAVLATSGALLTPAQAGPSDQKARVDARLDATREQLQDTSADLARSYLALKATEQRLAAAQARLAKAKADLAAARERDRVIGERLAIAEATVAKAEDDLAANADEVDTTTRTIGAIARQAYQTGGLGELGVALDAQSADDFATRVVLVDTAMRVQGTALNRLSVARAETNAKRARLVAVRRQVALLKAQAEANVIRARGFERAAAAAQQQVTGLLVVQRRQTAAIEARKAAEQHRLDRLQAESNRLQAILVERARKARLEAKRRAAARATAARRAAEARARAGRNSASRSDNSSGGYLSFPVSAPINSEYGMRFHPVLQYWRLHAGTDFAAACGTPVRAAASGEVISAGWAGGYGNQVVLDHGLVGDDSLASSYSHLSSIRVGGGNVSRGQVIGYVGTTGVSTGCHLHFEVYDDGRPVNPRRWL